MSPKLPPRIPSLKRKTLTAGSRTLTHTLVVVQNSLSEMSLSMSTHCQQACFSHNIMYTI